MMLMLCSSSAGTATSLEHGLGLGLGLGRLKLQPSQSQSDQQQPSRKHRPVIMRRATFQVLGNVNLISSPRNPTIPILTRHSALYSNHNPTNSLFNYQLRQRHSPLLLSFLPSPLLPRYSLSPSFSSSMATATTADSPLPPKAKKTEYVMEMFGDVRVDNYYWLRDDSRSCPDVLSHLKQENAYTDSIMADTKGFEEKLFGELRGRIKEADVSAPTRKGDYYYYNRTLEGKEYVQRCRRRVVYTDYSVHDVMQSGPEDPPEHVILDENIKAQPHQYYSIGAFTVSPNHKLVAYAEDTTGDEIYTVHVIDAETLSPVGQPLTKVTADVEWAGDDALVYITMDDILRPDKAWLHKLGTDQSTDCCLYHEKDDTFSLSLQLSESHKYLFISSESKTTKFVFYVDVSKPEDGPKVLTSCVTGIDTSVSHRGNHFFIMRRSDEVLNSELLACPVDDISSTTVLIPHRESIKIQDIQLFADHLVAYERENGLPKITVYQLPPVNDPLTSLKDGRTVDFVDPAYMVYPRESPYASGILRFSYSSLRTPSSVYDYDMNTGITVLKKAETVLGGFDSSNYVTERKWATALDGTEIPISIVYHKGLVKLDGSAPLLLYGYGSYEMCIDPSFKASRLALLDRGFVFAIAHIRGGGEMGRQWYENGKFFKKKNTFADFIACAEYLIQNKYCSKEKLCIEGRSAGGLLIGSVLNMRPDLFKAAVSGVPFVDVVTTMLDPTIPLTTAEWEEWGDPRKEEFYQYMKSYSPVDNVAAQDYPNILVTAGLHDPRVLYSEPAKYVAKLREMKTDNNMLLFKCEFGAGHMSKSGRFEKLHEDAFIYTFLLKALNMIPPSHVSQ
ncbi:Protease 2 [Linum perenne]